MNTISDAMTLPWCLLATKTFNIAGTKNSVLLSLKMKPYVKPFKQKQLANNQHEIPTIGLITTQAALTYVGNLG